MAGCGAVPEGGVGRWAVAAARLQPPGSGEASAARASPWGIVRERTGHLGRGGGGGGRTGAAARRGRRKHRAIPTGPRNASPSE